MSIVWNVNTYAQLPSTQDYVRELAEEGLPEGVVVQALTQTKGRGRQGRVWVSPMGNLYMTLLLRPGCAARDVGQLSFVMAVALSAAMDEVLAEGHKKTLKWPNDILIDGRKCAGILLESNLATDGTVDAVIAGIGVNILSAPEGAACLQEVCRGRQVPVHPFRDLALSHIAAYYDHWRKKGFADIHTRWIEQAHGLGQPVAVVLPDGKAEGVFRELDKNGALVLEMPDGTVRTVNTGDVFF